ncbi:hypothetical protein C7S15_5349 [Burkholderia cepacia]|nr:hypothetical protein [Burkholderia cepacia]
MSGADCARKGTGDEGPCFFVFTRFLESLLNAHDGRLAKKAASTMLTPRVFSATASRR